jgi:hypothetical protein
MSDRNRENLTGHPSDYGSRTIEDAEAEQRTADGEPRVDRGSAGSAISHDAQDVREEEKPVKGER